MADIISKTYDFAAGTISVKIRDAFGVEQGVTIQLDADRCPTCLAPMGNAGTDADAAITVACAAIDARVDRLMPKFESQGANVTAAKALRGK